MKDLRIAERVKMVRSTRLVVTNSRKTEKAMPPLNRARKGGSNAPSLVQIDRVEPEKPPKRRHETRPSKSVAALPHFAVRVQPNQCFS